MTVARLLEHLISLEGEKLPREQIAVATGDQKELDGVEIGSRQCPIRFVITVEALKEGWDCPFAYVLCSLQNARSAKDVEQLLGRILRMPYARSRKQPELNKAYAHIVADGFAQVADALSDKLVTNMGFNAYEAALAIQPVQAVLTGDDDDMPLFRRTLPESAISLPAMPAQPVPAALADLIELRPTTGGATALVRGELTEAVEEFLLLALTAKQQAPVREAIERARVRQSAALAPAMRGVPFAPLPQLCLAWEGEVQPLDRRLCADLGHFDLFGEVVGLPSYAPRELANTLVIDMDGRGHVTYGVEQTKQYSLNEVAAHASEQDLVTWLDRECHQRDIYPAHLLRWLGALVAHLQRDRGFTLTALVRTKYQVAEAVHKELDLRRQRAVLIGFQTALPGLAAAPATADSFRYHFTFHPDRYAGRPPFYAGRFRFDKHYYGSSQIHDLREKTEAGKPTEEFLCAQAIERTPQVKHWVRNVARDEKHSFWLPTSTDYFYPDFVAELIDGRVLVIEYKGQQLQDNADSREKAQIGHQWEASSGGRCLFLMATAADAQGRDVAAQIAGKIGGLV